MPRAKKVESMVPVESVPVRYTTAEVPKRSLRLLSWDKVINAGMLHIGHEGKSAVYHVRRMSTPAPTFQFQKIQPTMDGVCINAPYTVHLYKDGDSKNGYRGVCHCQGYKARKECRHVDAAITMMEEYGV